MRRIVAMLTVALAAALTLPAVPASAASLGTLTLSPASGTVDANPMFATATAATRCPAGYGTNAGLGIGRAGSPLTAFVPLARVADAGNYDTVAPNLAPNRSMRAALGSTPVTDGKYTVIVRCTSESAGDNPEVFSVDIVVTGAAWSVAGGGTGPAGGPTGTAGPTGGSGGSKVTLSTEVGPAVTGGSASASPAAGGQTSGHAGGDLPRTGPAVAGLVLLGLGLVAGGVLIVRLVRRRRLA